MKLARSSVLCALVAAGCGSGHVTAPRDGGGAGLGAAGLGAAGLGGAGLGGAGAAGGAAGA
ncbi:MAG TPA: hypothetical protein VHL80_00405, partial [Polyangia bacterium]|nr:hypothetical protein [Polyangia bacterium]